MKRQQNLPTLQNSSRKHSQSKDGVKQIQTKIIQHQTQISRNQKFIVSIANDFRLIKEELAVKQKENEQISQMYTKAVQQNQRVLKAQKQLKGTIAKLQKIIQDKNKRIQALSQSASTQSQNSNVNHKYAEHQLLQLKQEALLQAKKVLILQQTNLQLQKQLQEEKKQRIIQTQRYKDYKLNSETNESNKVKPFQQNIEKLNSQIKKYNEQVKEMEQQIKKLKQISRDKDKIISQNKKYQDQLKQLKVLLQNSKDEDKKRKNLIVQLQKKLKNQEQGNKNQRQTLTIIKQLETQIKSLKQKNQVSEEKIKTLNSELRILTIQKQAKNKENIKFKKVLKHKQQVQNIVKNLRQAVKCEFCDKILNSPVTCIPCGHSFCLQCKKGYQKQCKKCSPSVKRQAVYRNQLLDEIILSYEQIKKVVQILHLFN